MISRKEIKEREKRHFDSEGIYLLNYFERKGGFFYKFLAKQVLKSWDKHIKFITSDLYKDKVILDVCCGNPRVVSYLKKMGGKFQVGCDISFGMLKRANNVQQNFVYDKTFTGGDISYVQGDCENLPFKDEVFDTILCIQSLHHTNMEDLFKESSRALKKGGTLFISDPNGSNPMRSIADFIGKRTKVMSRDEKSISPSHILSSLERHGFSIENKYYLNLLSEPFFVMTSILQEKLTSRLYFMNLFIVLFNFIDDIAEKTIFKLYPNLSWRFVAVSVKPKTDTLMIK